MIPGTKVQLVEPAEFRVAKLTAPAFHKPGDVGYTLPYPEVDNVSIKALRHTHIAIFWTDRRGGPLLHPELGLPFTLAHRCTLATFPRSIKEMMEDAGQ